jgi:NodT family efflux transporter outer membrane factor (OMF) lipoprotein
VSLAFGAATLRDASQSTNHNSSRGIFGIGWEPDVWGKLRAERAAAKQRYAATALDYAWARQSLVATTAQSWYQAVALRQILAIEDETAKAYAELLRLAKIKQAAGQVADLDGAEATANLNEAQDQVRKTQGLLLMAERNLEVLLGRYPAAALAVKQEFDTLPPPVQAGLPSSLLDRRPDIAAAEHLVLEAFRVHEAAKLALLPSFALNVDGGRINDTLLDILRQNPWYYHADVGMTVPIYTGGRLTAEVKIASALEQQSIKYYGSVVLNAFREVEDALTNERVLAEHFFYLETALKARIDSVRLATIRYKAGAYDMLPVLQLQTSQYQTQVEMTMVRASRLTNCIDLHLALGGSFDAVPAATIP